MTLQVKTATGYKLVLNVWQKQNNNWTKVPKIFYKANGLWSLVHEGQNAFIFEAVISANVNNYNLRNAAIAAGWDTTVPLIATVTINTGVVVSSTTSVNYAFNTGSLYPDGSLLTLTNRGIIVGLGGKGGRGGGGLSIAGQYAGEAGAAGGPAFFTGIPTVLNNIGSILGGGGGGAGGVLYSCVHPSYQGVASSGGGGGGRGYGVSVGGVHGDAYTSDQSSFPAPIFYCNLGFTGANGSYTSIGDNRNHGEPTAYNSSGVGGEISAYYWDSYEVQQTTSSYAGYGADGGGFGSAGANALYNPESNASGFSTPFTTPFPPALGGAGGPSIVGISLVTLTNTGTIIGAQV